MELMITVATRSILELHFYHVLLLFIVIVCISAILLRKAINGQAKPRPPGPPAWPIIGHLHLLGDLPHQSFCKLSKTYGPLMGMRLGSVPIIVASSPEMAKQILHTHDLTFANRPHLAAGDNMYFHGTSLGMAPYGPYWKLMRQLCASELFSTKRLDSFRQVRKEEVRALALSVLQIGRQGGEKVELRRGLFEASNNITCRMAMGKKITDISAKMSGESSKLDLVSLVEEVLYLLSVFYVGDFIPWLAWLDPQGCLKRMKQAGQIAKALMQDVIDKRRESHQEAEEDQGQGGPHDFLDALLAASRNKDHDIQITDDGIMALLMDLFAGGSDTSSVTVEWALADLINNPNVMKKVQEELDNVVGKTRLVEEADMERLPYLGALIKESMRLHPVAPLLIPHEAIQECQIGGYTIPAKSRAYVNTWAIGRDDATWERPLQFWPERFDDKKLDLRGQNFELLPFGSGRRRCPGWGLGLLNVHLMLATLLHGFTWALASPNDASSTHFLDMSEKFGLTVAMATPLRAYATPRLPLHLY